ncbi:DUF6538 domain-containing protein [Rhodanobacter sp. Si-c]|uniref:DUF6538 domain-containing protein n=1 Tax=Rhodanobacter lycopersici TaxID=3162487 RepID=A0ABV3QH32_9GAMM
MRLAHHLIRHPSGVWHFRLVVPRRLHAAIGLKIIKRSLLALERLGERGHVPPQLSASSATLTKVMDARAHAGDDGPVASVGDRP